MNRAANKLQDVKKFRNKLRQTLAMRKTHERNQLIAKMNSLGVQSLFKEATAFVKKCCQKQHRNKGACMCINQLRIQSFNT